MKLKDIEGKSYDTNVEENTSLDFGIGNPSVIIDILRNRLYANPIRTLVQEYIANAYDACIEAKVSPEKIEIQIPTTTDPTFAVRDYGPGLSPERIREVFVLYGASTKRSTNKQIGGFGIGAKSAWSYTDSFVIESYYNGTHTSYLAHIGTKKEGTLNTLSVSPTTEKNGVEIKIAVKLGDISSFKDAVIRSVMLWTKKPVIHNLDISFPKVIFDNELFTLFASVNLLRLNNGVYLNANGVPYLYQEHPSSLSTSGILAIKANPGRMGISANREDFSNKQYAANLCTNIEKFFKERIQALFDKDDLDATIRRFKQDEMFSWFNMSNKCLNELLSPLGFTFGGISIRFTDQVVVFPGSNYPRKDDVLKSVPFDSKVHIIIGSDWKLHRKIAKHFYADTNIIIFETTPKFELDSLFKKRIHQFEITKPQHTERTKKEGIRKVSFEHEELTLEEFLKDIPINKFIYGFYSDSSDKKCSQQLYSILEKFNEPIPIYLISKQHKIKKAIETLPNGILMSNFIDNFKENYPELSKKMSCALLVESDKYELDRLNELSDKLKALEISYSVFKPEDKKYITQLRKNRIYLSAQQKEFLTDYLYIQKIKLDEDAHTLNICKLYPLLRSYIESYSKFDKFDLKELKWYVDKKNEQISQDTINLDHCNMSALIIDKNLASDQITAGGLR